MQVLQDVCKESAEQQTNVTHGKSQPQPQQKLQPQPQPPSPQYKMDKFYPPKPKINAFNDLFTCYLCQGYMINPTTIDVCSHTYCRSCIARHLAVDCYCPRCGKTITVSNLLADDVLRSIIFKLVPGLYQKERERLVQFVRNTKGEGKLNGATEESLLELLEIDDDFFSPTDPISLSLEFHPVLAAQCPEGSVPVVRYLQCPASVKVQHLKRFLCSKFEIDPSSRRVSIDIIYEDEILPSDFTLMDIGYCYEWQRHAPLKLTYRILIYNGDLLPKSDNGYVSDDKVSEHSYNENSEKSNAASSSLSKTISFPAGKTQICVNGEKEKMKAAPSQINKVTSPKSSSVKHSPSYDTPSNPEVPVKVTISRKPSSESRKSVSKKSSTDEFIIPTTTNDFKSLRSNDIRFSDYAITSSSTNTINSSSHATLANDATQSIEKAKSIVVKEEKPTKCNIVVSIPHNQMQEEWDTKPLSQLKTASKKSPNSNSAEAAIAAPPTKKVRNVPKLKIELNSLKSKLIEKPKSADIRLDTLMIKHHRPRKFSLDEPQPVVDKVDLETYVKNIGLKPIEIQATNKFETTDKYTPNASPMSSSSSTTSSSTSNFNFNSSDMPSSSSSSSHKKRKKKHSKDSRESKDSKRKKMHAEISSHSAEESLKMKVKLTPSINLKSLKLESKKSPPFFADKITDPLEFGKSKCSGNKFERNDSEKPQSADSKLQEISKEKLKYRSSETKKYKSPDNKPFQDIKKSKDFEKFKPLEIKISLGENANKSSQKEFDDDEDLVIPDSTSIGLSKPLASIKETKLPHSPPLPPSLFKTTPITFSTFSSNVTTLAKPKPVAIPRLYKEKPKPLQMKLIAPKPIAAKTGQQTSLSSTSSFKTPQFVVPNPPRYMASNTKFLSTPTSIASAANKHMGNLLKRSVSLDGNKNSGPLSKQQRLEKPNQITISAYCSNLHMTKVEIPATPTSSTAKATYEIPLYSPLSASYNPKCSFSVNSTTSAVKSTNAILQNPTTSSATPTKHTFTANAVATSKTDVDVKKATSNSIKPASITTTTTTTSSMASTNNKTPTTPTTSVATLMGPPLPIQKFNSNLAAASTAIKSPPLSAVLSLTTTSTLNSTSTAQHTPVLSTAFLSSPLSMVNYRQSKVLLAHAKPLNLPQPSKTSATASAAAAATAPGTASAATTIATAAATTTTSTITTATITTTPKTSVYTTNGLASEKTKSSLRQFRLPSREAGQDILDLSASTKGHAAANGVTEKQASKLSTATTNPGTNSNMIASAGSSLEMALNKIKLNMTTTTTATTTNAAKPVDNISKKQELRSPITDDLQNLHLLSESATAREKIAISTSASPAPPQTSLYEKAKITQNSLVRQQNASVRNIPNPSALAFRNQQPSTTIPPMVTIAAGLATSLTDLDKPLLLKTPSSPKSPHSPSCTTCSSSSSSRNVAKKHPSIDQVAASLNQRASAAAEASAKANLKQADQTALVSSTSSVLTDKLDKKEIKQESADAQSEASPVPSSSTVNSSCPLVNVLNIKKEPEEKSEETREIKPSAFVKATSKKSTIVENLVTSVINVTTPTSTVLTATTAAAGF